ncbi:hypothetical protein J5X84_39485 [Streptosporangiaceae bacterium NEAU-GS5]|nr:hypothetical protein [Streptosporangiaceae bacterium NEAU-GS5]
MQDTGSIILLLGWLGWVFFVIYHVPRDTRSRLTVTALTMSGLLPLEYLGITLPEYIMGWLALYVVIVLTKREHWSHPAPILQALVSAAGLVMIAAWSGGTVWPHVLVLASDLAATVFILRLLWKIFDRYAKLRLKPESPQDDSGSIAANPSAEVEPPGVTDRSSSSVENYAPIEDDASPILWPHYRRRSPSRKSSSRASRVEIAICLFPYNPAGLNPGLPSVSSADYRKYTTASPDTAREILTQARESRVEIRLKRWDKEELIAAVARQIARAIADGMHMTIIGVQVVDTGGIGSLANLVGALNGELHAQVGNAVKGLLGLFGLPQSGADMVGWAAVGLSLPHDGFVTKLKRCLQLLGFIAAVLTGQHWLAVASVKSFARDKFIQATTEVIKELAHWPFKPPDSAPSDLSSGPNPSPNGPGQKSPNDPALSPSGRRISSPEEAQQPRLSRADEDPEDPERDTETIKIVVEQQSAPGASRSVVPWSGEARRPIKPPTNCEPASAGTHQGTDQCLPGGLSSPTRRPEQTEPDLLAKADTSPASFVTQDSPVLSLEALNELLSLIDQGLVSQEAQDPADADSLSQKDELEGFEPLRAGENVEDLSVATLPEPLRQAPMENPGQSHPSITP